MAKPRLPQPTVFAQSHVKRTLQLGEIAIDATAGNGHDTQFLAACVGERGRVYAFDIQPEALAETATRTANATQVVLLLRDHAEMLEAIPVAEHGRVGAAMFNLGYRPGGDKAITTQARSTLTAMQSALEILRPDGVMTVVAYPGHNAGSEEFAVVEAFFRGLPAEFALHEMRNENSAAPQLFVVHKPQQSG
jgi:16S rRNA C1402 N4-methylase RsmH